MSTPKHLADYMPPPLNILSVNLSIHFAEAVEVVSELAVGPRAGQTPGPVLTLDAEAMELLEVTVDGRTLAQHEYRYDGAHLTIPWPTASIRTRVRIDPDRNTRLEGLFPCGGGYFTQCEAEGFRRITPYLDRPDVLAPFEVTLHADRQRFPVLLANGNCVATGSEGDRHWARWVDPYLKPAYLFAVVAADLACVEDRFRTASGREVALACYVAHGLEDRCAHALNSLKAAMRWDEDTYGREYDLDRYMIVAVSDFNMGAMENKGLNIFNSQFVLARPDTATDDDYHHIASVVAHEYFHNWTGNRITCRDWFQLSLKEGLTVFRDQCFSADQPGGAVQRIRDVARLTATQFREDAGPLAHPVRPESYLEINNFYTATVYEKGAEVVRMMANTLGPAGFRRGMDCYFERHDGQAVTVEDFIAALGAGGGQELSDFLIWYRQAGTPRLTARGVHDPARRTYTLELVQQTPPTPGQSDKQAVPIPVRMALLDASGAPLPLRLTGEAQAAGRERVLVLREGAARFCFEDVAAPPVPSLLRGFSAPVQLDDGLTLAGRLHLLRHDDDAVVRWQAARGIWIDAVRQALAGAGEGFGPEAIAGFGSVLGDRALDPALAAELLAPPPFEILLDACAPADPHRLETLRQTLRSRLAKALEADWVRCYNALAGRDDPAARALRNRCLYFLMADDLAERHAARALDQFNAAETMTERLAALALLTDHGGETATAALAAFHDRHAGDDLVLDKWFRIQAQARPGAALDRLDRLMTHPAFRLTQPNKVRAVVGAFAQGNPLHFHAPDGSGYVWVAERIAALIPLNPQLAARLAGVFAGWRDLPAPHRDRMRAQLARLADQPDLPPDLEEVLGKALSESPA